MSSPRPWGCFRAVRDSAQEHKVFPTPVGVFLRGLFHQCIQRGLPHARGGVSPCRAMQDPICESSPRPWGCFRSLLKRRPRKLVFPTPVGVFPRLDIFPDGSLSLPHARGGVSQAKRPTALNNLSSPRPWGCFYSTFDTLSELRVFPTPVGVFLSATGTKTLNKSLPHARGGVSLG